MLHLNLPQLINFYLNLSSYYVGVNVGYPNSHCALVNGMYAGNQAL